MLLCPNCRVELETQENCGKCEWSLKLIDGLKNFLKPNIPTFIKDYIENYDQIATDDLDKSIQPINALESHAKSMLDDLNLSPDLTCCDIGGGQGFLAKALRDKGVKDITLIDIAIPYLKTLDNDFKCIIADAENLPYENEFDLIFATDILEHVINMGSFLYCVNKALKPKGKFLVRAPVNENLMSYSPLLGCKYDFVHLRTFNKTLFKQTIENAGFKVSKISFSYYWIFAPKEYIANNKILNFAFSIIAKVAPKIFKIENNYFEDNTFMRKIFCKILLRPFCITAIAEKKNELQSY